MWLAAYSYFSFSASSIIGARRMDPLPTTIDVTQYAKYEEYGENTITPNNAFAPAHARPRNSARSRYRLSTTKIKGKRSLVVSGRVAQLKVSIG